MPSFSVIILEANLRPNDSVLHFQMDSCTIYVFHMDCFAIVTAGRNGRNERTSHITSVTYRVLDLVLFQSPSCSLLVSAAKRAEETDDHRISQRQKQIDYGKNTLGYERYTECIPR